MHGPGETIEQPEKHKIAEAPTVPPSASADGLVRVLDEYMAALQAGPAPDRRQLLAEHPELAAQLEAVSRREPAAGKPRRFSGLIRRGGR